jgi:hypothetical protein
MLNTIAEEDAAGPAEGERDEGEGAVPFSESRRELGGAAAGEQGGGNSMGLGGDDAVVAAGFVFESDAAGALDGVARRVREVQEELMSGAEAHAPPAPELQEGGSVAAATPPPPSEQQQEQLAQQQQLQEQQLGAPPRAQLRSRRKGVSVLRRGGKPAAAAADKALEHALEDEEYEYQGLGPDFDAKDPRDPSRLKRPWVVPTVGGAEMYRSREVFGGGKAPILGTTDADFAPLGSGVALYFRLLFSFSLLFFVLSFLALPSIFFAAQGKRLPSTTPDSLKFARVSLGNVGPLQYDGIEKKRGDVEAEYQHLWGSIFDTTRDLAAMAFNTTASGAISLAMSPVGPDLRRYFVAKVSNISADITRMEGTRTEGKLGANGLCTESTAAAHASDCKRLGMYADLVSLYDAWGDFFPAAWPDKLDFWLSRQTYAVLKLPGLGTINITGAYVAYIVAGCDVFMIIS